jgi:hypothetical protein
MSQLMIHFAEQMQLFVQLRESDQKTLKKLQRKGLPEGVEFGSVANEPEN